MAKHGIVTETQVNQVHGHELSCQEVVPKPSRVFFLKIIMNTIKTAQMF